MEKTLDVAVVGGGIVGLGVAWRLLAAGRSVRVFDQGAAGRGATWAAGGMLAPAAEIGFEELELYRLSRESLTRWPLFGLELEAASGMGVGYDATGTLVVADDRDAAGALRRLYSFQQEQGVPVTWLTTDEALDREPLLSPRIAGAIWSPEDHQVDNRAVARALVAVVKGKEALQEHTPVLSVEPAAEPGSPAAIVLKGGERVTARVVVMAAGAWTGGVGGLEPRPPIRPVKGQLLALRMEAPLVLRHVIRTPRAYLAPKSDGRLVVGATSEDVGFDTRVTAGGLYRVLDGAVRVVPAVEELEVLETWAGLRPAARDHAPLVGRAAPGVWLATGHYRHGILLAPVTADEVAREVGAALDGRDETSPHLAPFSPARLFPQADRLLG